MRVMSNDNVLVDGMTDDGSYVLRPKNGDWGAVAAFAANVFDAYGRRGHYRRVNSPRRLRIEVQNGTTVTGLAQRTANSLLAAGFAVSRVTNAPTRQYDKTVIYALTKGEQATRSPRSVRW